MALSLPRGARIVAATHNPGKAKELAALLEGRFQVVSAGELSLPEPDETETTFVGNAVLKARAAADRSGLIALFANYGAATRIVYVEAATWQEMFARNRQRDRRVPERVIERLAEKLEVPSPAEAHRVEYVTG